MNFRWRIVTAFVLAGIAGCTAVHPSHDLNVRSFGASGDGTTKDTAAFRAALDRCAATGGEVDIPAGNYLIGSIELHSGTTLRLEKDANLIGSPDAIDYPITTVRYEGEDVPGHTALLHATNADHIAIVGLGTLNGDPAIGDLRNPRGPVMIEFTGCKDIHLDGFNDRYRRLWSIHFLYCQNVDVRNLNIRTTRNNGDGIDVDSSTDVLIEHCDIDTGDDCISLKSGRGAKAFHEAKPTRNIMISDCILGSDFAGVGIGTEMSGGIGDVRIQRCKFTRGANAIYIKSRTGRGGYFENISGNELDASSRTFLGIDLLNKGIVGSDPLTGSEAIPETRKLSFTNITAHCSTLVDAARVSPDKPIDGFILHNITGTCKNAISLANVIHADVNKINVTGYAGSLLTIRNATGKGLDQATASAAGKSSISSEWLDMAKLEYAFDLPPEDARPMVRWWWFGPAVTKTELARELNVMKDGGFGGVEVQPTYPLAIDGQPAGVINQTFLSPQFLDDLKFTAAKTKELGLRMDLTLGSGWPYGGPMFPVTEAPGRLRIEKFTGDLPTLRTGESLIATFESQKLAFISSHTGMKVKRPSLGAEGFVIDHLDPTVVAKFMNDVARKEVEACQPNPPYSVFCDSLEVGGEDWTGHFLEEFQKRRGYDLHPLLPALVSDDFPGALDIRHDWGQTLTELVSEKFIQPLRNFAKENNTKFRIQAYGSPSAGLYSYAYADLPEGEGYQWHGYRATRYASSASHLMGIPVCSSEAFTWIHSPVFRATPLDIKAEADLHFLQGVNQLICHGWPSTPAGVPDPGWSFYASGVFDEKNPWYIVMPDLNRYLQRVSFMMRQGQPANDVLLYLANSDAWAHFTPGHISLSDGVGKYLGSQIVGRLLDNGYNFDFFDDGMLDRFGKVDGSTLRFGNVHYKMIVLAGVERIPVSTMQKLEAFAKAGGLVVATRRLPSIAPGYKAAPEDQKIIADISRRLFTDSGAPGIFVQDESKLGPALADRFPQDVVISPATSRLGIVHRHTASAEIYFLANTSNQPINVKATFGDSGLQPQWWDPMTGHITAARIVDHPADKQGIDVNLDPYASTLLLWTQHTIAETPIARQMVTPAPLDLSEQWTVQFGKNGPSMPMGKLHSWLDESTTRNFSGVAIYSKHFTVAPQMFAPDTKLSLTLGEANPVTAQHDTHEGNGFQADLDAPVREAAIVHINGAVAGSLWCPPYTLDVTWLLKPGNNEIRIEVANTQVNSIADTGFPNYDYKALVDHFGNRFTPPKLAQFEPVTSGLLGPIQLIALKAE
jgi:hypothetical protein